VLIKVKPKYPPEFCQKMVDLVLAGKKPSQLAKQYHCSAQSIQAWVARADVKNTKSMDDDLVDESISGHQGTQAVKRSVALLKLLARGGFEGYRLIDLALYTGLPHPTVRRILKCLIDERMVVQNQSTKRYVLGPLNFELGLATNNDLSIKRYFRPQLEKLAQHSGDTVYLSVRSGADAVCIDRVEGHSPIRAITLEIGGRRPLSFGASGQALMSHLSDAEIQEILAKNAIDIQNHPSLTNESLFKSIQQARKQGYSLINDTTIHGVSAIGIYVLKPDLPIVSISLAMVRERLTASRAKQLFQLLKSVCYAD